jgi:hypothetical protein
MQVERCTCSAWVGDACKKGVRAAARRAQEAAQLRGEIEALRDAPSALDVARARRDELAADRTKFAQLLDNLQARPCTLARQRHGARGRSLAVGLAAAPGSHPSACICFRRLAERRAPASWLPGQRGPAVTVGQHAGVLQAAAGVECAACRAWCTARSKPEAAVAAGGRATRPPWRASWPSAMRTRARSRSSWPQPSRRAAHHGPGKSSEWPRQGPDRAPCCSEAEWLRASRRRRGVGRNDVRCRPDPLLQHGACTALRIQPQRWPRQAGRSAAPSGQPRSGASLPGLLTRGPVDALGGP